MLRKLNALVICSLMTLGSVTQARAQSSAKPDDALKAVLLTSGDDFMSAWKKHDRVGIVSTLAPEFVAVGGQILATGVDDTIKD